VRDKLLLHHSYQASKAYRSWNTRTRVVLEGACMLLLARYLVTETDGTFSQLEILLCFLLCNLQCKSSEKTLIFIFT
jgi:hypothetical protein